MYFVIWWLQINLTVYHQYPPVAILTHKYLGVCALLELELEMTKIYFSFKAKPPEYSICIRVPSNVGRVYFQSRVNCCLLNGYFTRKLIDTFLNESWINYGGASRGMIGLVVMHNSCILSHIGTENPFTNRK